MALQSRHDDFFSPAAHRKRVLNGMYIHLLPLSPSSPVNSMFQYPLCSSSPHFVALRSYMAPLDPRLSPPLPERSERASQSAAIYDLFAASIPSPFFLIFTCESCEPVTHPPIPATLGLPPPSTLLSLSVVIWFGFGIEREWKWNRAINEYKGGVSRLLARLLPRPAAAVPSDRTNGGRLHAGKAAPNLEQNANEMRAGQGRRQAGAEAGGELDGRPH